MHIPKTILITGASSGLGAALAGHYAAPGITLALTGRDAARLAEVSKECESRGAKTITAALDVCDSGALASWIALVDARAPLDLVIANAGISGGTGGGGESAEQVRRIFAVNVDGVLNTILPAIALMRARKRGQIAIVSSVAGLRGLPSAPAYSASKAAVKAFGEGLRGELARDNIGVSVVLPGYIKTRMTDANDFPMPFLMSAEKAAAKIAAGLRKNRSRIAFPLALYLPAWLLSCLSPTLTDPLFAALPKKK